MFRLWRFTLREEKFSLGLNPSPTRADMNSKIFRPFTRSVPILSLFTAAFADDETTHR